MATKSISLSVRMTNEDLAMLSELDMQGALTPSDKIRSLVKMAHRLQHKRGDYEQALSNEAARFAPAQLGLRNAEARHRMHSEFLLRLLTWLPDANAVALSSIDESGSTAEELKVLEDALSERVLRLLLGVLNGFLAPEANWYGGKSSAARLSALLEAVTILERLGHKPTATGDSQ